jgi:hypothetical protein
VAEARAPGSVFSLYQGPRAIFFRCVWIPAVVSAALLTALPIVDRLTANDFSLGLLLKSIETFAFGLGALATLLFFVLLFFRDVPIAVKLRALAAVALPYIVVAILWLIAANQTHPVR